MRIVVELIRQPHGGAIQRGFTPEQAAAGGRARAQQIKERAARSEAIEEAVLEGVEKLSEVLHDVIDQACGEQWRCRRCGAFGPKPPQLRPRDLVSLAGQLLGILRSVPEESGQAPFIVQVVGPGQ